MRPESEILSELESLTSSKGYIYALAWIALTDDIIAYSAQAQGLTDSDFYSEENLIRTEISTLAGLLFKSRITLDPPIESEFGDLIDNTHSLMSELHQALVAPFRPKPEELKAGLVPSFSSLMRESFFYSGESAYYFQFRDFTYEKYIADNDWFVENKGYSVSDYSEILKAISAIYGVNVSSLEGVYSEGKVNLDILLGLFTITESDIVEKSGIDKEIVKKILQDFYADTPCNDEFNHLNDFNLYNAKPLIEISEGVYLLFQIYSICEAFYESPYYWMGGDENYCQTAFANRGKFSESYTARKLSQVFGEKNVHKNVNIISPNKNRISEIDVLVLFSDRAIIVQNKSKRLTLEARKGNDQKIRSDFSESVQSSYDQALLCAWFLGEESFEFRAESGELITVRNNYSEIYPVCIVLDVYPALNFQVRDFLRYEANDVIQPPLVLDTFTLDVFVEFLTSPIRFLSYLNVRANYLERVSSTHEFEVLSYHLKRNLYIDEDVSMVHLHGDISMDLDLAMMARRDSYEGEETPEGVLTRYINTHFGRLLAQIEHEENEALINLGFVLMRAGEDTINVVNDGLETIISAAIRDGGTHDFGFGIADTGVTIHCNRLSFEEAEQRLLTHASLKKYTQKKDSWFALLVSPSTELNLLMCVHINDKWEYSYDMDKAAKMFFQRSPKWESEAAQPPSSKSKDKKRKRRKVKNARRKHRKR